MSQSDGHRDEAYRALPDADGEPAGPETDADGAEEKLLSKEREAQVVANMADAKYKSADLRNGEAKIEIDAGKRTFTGLTKEELLKYQNDPFWVRLRWVMFILFWALWLAMLAGAIVIIVQSPKCPKPKTHFEKNAMVNAEGLSLAEVGQELSAVESGGVRSVLVSYSGLGDLYDETVDLQPLKELAEKANSHRVKVIVEVTANSVNKSHPWFVRSERREEGFDDYFIWANGKPGQQPPNNWVSLSNESAWSYSEFRKQYYLHQLSADTADLNFRTPQVVEAFEAAMKRIVTVGVGGFRLIHGQQLLVDASLKDDVPAAGRPSGAVHTEYAYYSHRATSDQPELGSLLRRWRRALTDTVGGTVLFLSGDVRPQKPEVPEKAEGEKEEDWSESLPPVKLSAEQPPEQVALTLNKTLDSWPSIPLEGTGTRAREFAIWTLLLPATPILRWEHVFDSSNGTWKVDDKFKEVNQLRQKSGLHHARTAVLSVANNTLLAVTRSGVEVGYLGLFNPTDADVPVDASVLGGVPLSLTSLDTKQTFNSTEVNVPAESTSVFLYEPVAEN